MISISKINLRELLVYSSDTRLAERDFLPISRARALSFMANPRSNLGDNVLYQAHFDGNLVGYLTVLPDTAFINDNPHRFAWIEGAWVHPSFRRIGIAIKLIDSALADWNGMLMAANFLPIAKTIFDKTKTFKLIKQIEGRRFYLRKTTLKTYNCCRHTGVFPIIWEKSINLLNLSNITRKFLKLPKGVELEYFNRPDEEIIELLTNSTQNTLTRRGAQEIIWILRYPWLTNGVLPDRQAKKYFFASVVPNFNHYLVKVFHENDLIGVVLMQHSNTRFTVPYYWFANGSANLMARLILIHAGKCGASFINLYNDELIKAMGSLRGYFLYSTKRIRQYLASETMAEIMSAFSFELLDGDGDSAFI